MTVPEPWTASAAGLRAQKLRRSPVAASAAGGVVGVLGGMIGLGGTEFRLPLLISLFGFVALQAVIVNKAMSLAVVLTALPARLVAVPHAALAPHWPVAVNLLAGSLAGAWAGASWATRMCTATLHKVLAGLMVLMAAALVLTHLDGPTITLGLYGWARALVGLVVGFGIGVVAAVMGVAGGELLIPTIVLLYGLDIKLAGSLSLAVSLPTMLVAFARYSRDQAFAVLRGNGRFLVAMTVGSVVGSVVGALLLGAVPNLLLIPALALLLLLSATKLLGALGRARGHECNIRTSWTSNWCRRSTRVTSTRRRPGALPLISERGRVWAEPASFRGRVWSSGPDGRRLRFHLRVALTTPPTCDPVRAMARPSGDQIADDPAVVANPSPVGPAKLAKTT